MCFRAPNSGNRGFRLYCGVFVIAGFLAGFRTAFIAAAQRGKQPRDAQVSYRLPRVRMVPDEA